MSFPNEECTATWKYSEGGSSCTYFDETEGGAQPTGFPSVGGPGAPGAPGAPAVTFLPVVPDPQPGILAPPPNPEIYEPSAQSLPGDTLLSPEDTISGPNQQDRYNQEADPSINVTCSGMMCIHLIFSIWIKYWFKCVL